MFSWRYLSCCYLLSAELVKPQKSIIANYCHSDCFSVGHGLQNFKVKRSQNFYGSITTASYHHVHIPRTHKCKTSLEPGTKLKAKLPWFLPHPRPFFLPHTLLLPLKIFFVRKASKVFWTHVEQQRVLFFPKSKLSLFLCIGSEILVFVERSFCKLACSRRYNVNQHGIITCRMNTLNASEQMNC